MHAHTPILVQKNRSVAVSAHRFFTAHGFHAPARFALALLLTATLSAAAFAGSAVDATTLLTVNVNEGASAWNPVKVDTSFLSIDPTTGDIKMPSSLPNTTNWSWGTVGVYNPITGLFDTKNALTWTNNTGSASFSIYANGNVDPIMNYSIFGTNHSGVTQTYSLHYDESVVPPVVPGTYGLFSDIGYSLSTGDALASTISPTTGSKIQHLSLSTNGGISYTNAGVDVGGAQTSTATTATYYDSLSGGGSALATIDHWAFDVSFDVSAHDAAGVSGYTEITQLTVIPEPSTYAALLGGVTLVGAALRRRRQVAV